MPEVVYGIDADGHRTAAYIPDDETPEERLRADFEWLRDEFNAMEDAFYELKRDYKNVLRENSFFKAVIIDTNTKIDKLIQAKLNKG